MSNKTPQISIVEISSSKDTKIELLRKIEFITHDLSKPYFRNTLMKLVKESGDNANIICDYIIAEINEINIKPLTREGKIKITNLGEAQSDSYNWYQIQCNRLELVP